MRDSAISRSSSIFWRNIMNITHHPPLRESWLIMIESFSSQDACLIEEAPADESRSNYPLKEPLRNWLKAHEHKMNTDRGDFGEGDERWYITVFTQKAVDQFKEISETLK